MARDPEKIILHEKEFPGNSKKAREVKEEIEPRAKRAPVAHAKRVKKSLLTRLSESFKDGGAGNEVVNYVLYDVVIPAAKSTFADLVEGAIEMILFGGGDVRNSRVQRRGGRSYVSYGDIYAGKPSSRAVAPIRHGVRRPSNVEPASRIRQDFSGVVLTSRAEAEIVLTEMTETVEQYGSVSVADLYDLVGLDHEYTDQNFGWFDLAGASTMRVRDGWALELPRPKVID